MKRLLVVIPLLFTGLFFFNTSSAQAIFIKIGDIKGESTDAKHKEWIDVLSFSDAMSRPGGGATGSSRSRGSVTFEDLSITKNLDKSSPKLIDAFTKGAVIPSVELEFATSNKIVFYKITLSNVLISSYSSEASETKRPSEKLSLNYEKITWEYIEPNGSKVTTSYNVERRM